MRPLELGTGTMHGERLIQSKYTHGPLAVIGTTYAQGSIYIGYGVENKSDGWYSTTSITIKHSVLIVDNGRLRYGTAQKSTAIPIGEPVTLDFREL